VLDQSEFVREGRLAHLIVYPNLGDEPRPHAHRLRRHLPICYVAHTAFCSRRNAESPPASTDDTDMASVSLRELELHPVETEEQIPTIDISPLKTGDVASRLAVANAFGKAAEDYGFALIVGHDIPASVISGGFDAGRRFFELPDDYKRSIQERRSNRGYQPMYDNLRHDGKPSAQEGYTIGHPISPTDPELAKLPFHSLTPWPPLEHFREPLEALYWALFGLGRDLLGALALHLGARDDFFESALTETYSHMRINHYPPHETVAHVADEGVFAHRDESLMTLLLQDENSGLQVGTRDERWIPVAPNPKAVVVNVGKMLRHWTGGRYDAALHRVINRSGRDRYSIPLFMHPGFHTVVDPRDLVGRVDGYPPIVAGETVNASFATTRKSWNDVAEDTAS
jgi:isopenicillin N synthase-like dioxygenase